MRDVTVLWAMRSPCNLGCTYCYFGTIEQHRTDGLPAEAGQLSHLSRHDVSLADIAHFCSTLGESAIRRIVIAGGEPLIWPPMLDVVEQIIAAGVEVVIASNAIPLNRPEITQRLVELGVAAVSVSLDSPDPALNDHYRPARNRSDGWQQVLTGIHALQNARGNRAWPRIGLYTVIHRRNLPAVYDMAAFGAELGVDYYVPQPMSLAPDHALSDELSLTSDHVNELREHFDRLYSAGLALTLPERSYAERFLDSVTTTEPGFIADCFGGAQLAFIQPNGSVWDCPSHLRIAATPEQRHHSILGHSAAELFPTEARPDCADCALFSRDCVSMWPLMEFDRVLHTGEAPAW